MICAREVAQAVCDVIVGSLFPWFVQIRMSHYGVCWDSVVSVNRSLKIRMMLLVETLFASAERTKSSTVGYKNKSPTGDEAFPNPHKGKTSGKQERHLVC